MKNTNEENSESELSEKESSTQTSTGSSAKASAKASAKTSVIKEIISWVVTIALALALGLFIRNHVIINADIPSGSMENTIMTGDRIIGNRLAYISGEPKRGDIIIFKYPDDETQNFAKRIIGLPGEKVDIIDGKVYINDSETPLEEDYLKEEWLIAAGPYSYTVPDDSYFVMGDNRNNSLDSRYWINTYVPRSSILGKASLIYYPFDDAKFLN